MDAKKIVLKSGIFLAIAATLVLVIIIISAVTSADYSWLHTKVGDMKVYMLLCILVVHALAVSR